MIEQKYEGKIERFQHALIRRVKSKLAIRINDNRSTLLRVSWEPLQTRVSIHRFFLEAPDEILTLLALYIDRKTALPPALKAYITRCSQKLNYSVEQTLDQKGLHYNLQTLYQKVNREYFEGEASLLITWFGLSSSKACARVCFGLYQSALKLIKINRILDRGCVPEYFIRYIIFHEMLHHYCPPYVNQKGVNQIHNREFRQREKLFKEYDQAKQWMQNNKKTFFVGV